MTANKETRDATAAGKYGDGERICSSSTRRRLKSGIALGASTTCLALCFFVAVTATSKFTADAFSSAGITKASEFVIPKAASSGCNPLVNTAATRNCLLRDLNRNKNEDRRSSTCWQTRSSSSLETGTGGSGGVRDPVRKTNTNSVPLRSFLPNASLFAFVLLFASSSAFADDVAAVTSAAASSAATDLSEEIPFVVANSFTFMTTTTTTSLVADAETTSSWRQYVPLVVSIGVIIDILSGSPAANAVLNLIRSKAEEEASGAGGGESEKGTSGTQTVLNAFQMLSGGAPKDSPKVDSKERVDSMAMAQEAIDKAEATLELREYLEKSKSDWDKMEDIRRQMDAQLEELDSKQKKSGES